MAKPKFKTVKETTYGYSLLPTRDMFSSGKFVKNLDNLNASRYATPKLFSYKEVLRFIQGVFKYTNLTGQSERFLVVSTKQVKEFRYIPFYTKEILQDCSRNSPNNYNYTSSFLSKPSDSNPYFDIVGSPWYGIAFIFKEKATGKFVKVDENGEFSSCKTPEEALAFQNDFIGSNYYLPRKVRTGIEDLQTGFLETELFSGFVEKYTFEIFYTQRVKMFKFMGFAPIGSGELRRVVGTSEHYSRFINHYKEKKNLRKGGIS